MAFMKKFSGSSDVSTGSKLNLALRLTVRFLQLVLALTVAGLYGVDLDNARKAHVYADGKWVYAEVVAALAAITAILFMAIPQIKSWFLWIWDAVLFLLWTALFGLFGNMYIKEKAEGDTGVQRMKNAVWVDLVNMLLWFLTAVAGAVLFLKERRGRTLHTGRAQV